MCVVGIAKDEIFLMFQLIFSLTHLPTGRPGALGIIIGVFDKHNHNRVIGG